MFHVEHPQEREDPPQKKLKKRNALALTKKNVKNQRTERECEREKKVSKHKIHRLKKHQNKVSLKKQSILKIEKKAINFEF